MITRRQFLIGGCATALACSGGLALEDHKMERAPEREGKIFADLHTHPHRDNNLESTIKTLSRGITGLTSTRSRKILTYQMALELNGHLGVKIKEIDRGLFAKVTYKGNTGYILNSQEILSDHHIYTFGIREQLLNYRDSRKAAEEIKKRKGVVIIDHPYIIATKNQVIRYRMINEKEEKKIRELCQMADEIEVFNAQSINLIPILAWANGANDMSKELAKEYGFKGTASSDTHGRLEQIQVAGIYLPKDTTSIEALKERIAKKDFERYEQYVSKISFIKGHFFSKFPKGTFR